MAGVPIPMEMTEFTLEKTHPSDRSRPVRWIWSHARRHWAIMLMLFIGAVGNAALAAVVPVMTGQAFNDMLASPPRTQLLLPLALILGGSQLIRGVLQFGRNFGAELLAQRMEREIRDELYLSLLGKSMTFHNIQPVGDTMARATNDVREINFMFSPGINIVVGSLTFLVMPFLFAPRYNLSLLLTPALFTIAYVLALWRYLKNLNPVAEAVRDSFGALNTRLAEALDGIETVKGAAQEAGEVQRFNLNAGAFRNAFVRQGDMEARFLPMLLLGLALGGGLLHALLLFRNGLLDTGGVVAYFGLLMMLDFPTFASTFAYTQVSLGVAGARRVLELMNRENILDQNAGGITREITGKIEFKSVDFAYQGQEACLQDICFAVSPGQTVAIVGQTGSGKTSLVKLINRTYDALRGQVLVDGVDVRDWNLASLRQQISIIEQDIFLFSRSIADNIAFGKPGASREEIEAAARAAQAHEFIMEFEQGYETVIGERGVTLSGGQRQRLALARAFLTNPRILVLDDSTSAIDSATEDLIQRAIANAARGRTTLLITHRLSQIRWADLIIVLRKGRLAAMGSHEQLMQTSPAYRRIFSE